MKINLKTEISLRTWDLGSDNAANVAEISLLKTHLKHQKQMSWNLKFQGTFSGFLGGIEWA
jgi:hypothetical protein